MPFNIQGPELILILVIALLIIGPGKLPDVGSALGKSIREFRKAATDVKDATSIPPVTAGATPAATASPAPAAPPISATPTQSGQAEATPAETPSEPAT
jgi:TatA/E family protein of Tat protein translocase